MESIEDQVMVDFAGFAASKVIPLRGKDAGRYATRVLIAAPQGSQWNGRYGTVVRVQDDTVFVRLQVGSAHSVVLPFGRGELVAK